MLSFHANHSLVALFAFFFVQELDKDHTQFYGFMKFKLEPFGSNPESVTMAFNELHRVQKVAAFGALLDTGHTQSKQAAYKKTTMHVWQNVRSTCKYL